MDDAPGHDHITAGRLALVLLLASIVASAQVRGYDPAIRDRIEATRRALREFTNDLPDFVCEQQTRRFRGTGKVSEWRTLDRVTASMIYLRGEEHTTNIKIDDDSSTWIGKRYAVRKDLRPEVRSHRRAFRVNLIPRIQFPNGATGFAAIKTAQYNAWLETIS